MNFSKIVKAYTVIELLVVILIISLLFSTASFLFLYNREKSRDVQRINDVNQIQVALDMYKRVEGRYPSSLSFGDPLMGFLSGTIFMDVIPTNKVYKRIQCEYDEYNYSYNSQNDVYEISFCMEHGLDLYSIGLQCLRSDTSIIGDCHREGYYTFGQIDQMIRMEDYIPISSVSDYLNIVNNSINTMGEGTDWEGDYLTGPSKKYIQLNGLDFSEESALNRISLEEGFVYDGNDLHISGASLLGDGLFVSTSPGVKNLRNIVLSNINSTTRSVLIAVGSSSGFVNVDNIEIDDCHIVTSYGQVGLVSSVVYAPSKYSNIKVTNSSINGNYEVGVIIGASSSSSNLVVENVLIDNVSIENSSNRSGGVLGRGSFDSINNVLVNDLSIIGGPGVAGVIGLIETNSGVISNCSISGSFTGDTVVGGIIGIASSGVSSYSVENCYSTAKLYGSEHVGGLVGIHRVGYIKNSYFASTINDNVDGLNIGGIIGSGLGSVISSYFDADLFADSDIDAGSPRGTIIMQSTSEDDVISYDTNTLITTFSDSRLMFNGTYLRFPDFTGLRSATEFSIVFLLNVYNQNNSPYFLWLNNGLLVDVGHVSGVNQARTRFNLDGVWRYDSYRYPLLLNQEQLHIITWNGDYTRIYIDGVMVLESQLDSTYSSMSSHVSDLDLGWRSSVNNSDFNGYLKMFRIYNRALSDSDVVDLYNTQDVLYHENLILHSDFNSPGNYLKDLSNNSYDGFFLSESDSYWQVLDSESNWVNAYGIYSGWDPAVWDFSTNSYPSLKILNTLFNL